MYTYSIIILKIARKINRNVDFPGFSKFFIRLSANPHRKLRMIQPMFLDSYMSDICSDIAVSENSVRKFVSELGFRQNQLDAFMRDQVMPGSTLLFDGTSIFMRCADSLSDKGYNPDHSLAPQARILYVFEKDSHKPVFYRIVQGSIVDKTAFMDTVHPAFSKT